MKKIKLTEFSKLQNRTPSAHQINGLDLVVIKYGDNISVLYGRCLHRGALLADGHIDGHNLICGVHGWDYRYETGVSEYNNNEVLHKFYGEIKDNWIWVDEDEINQFLVEQPQPFNRDQYLGQYADTHPEETEPFTGYIQELARNGLKNYVHHGPSASMGVDVGVDYIILDGRGGGTGSAPTILRDNINVPTIAALARARKHLDKVGATGVTLIITGGLRLPEDFAKAMMLGADAIAVSNSAMQAIGCLGMRACGSNNCPVGIATQKESLRSRLIIESSAKQLHNFLIAANNLIKVVARSCGHDDVGKFNFNDLSTIDHDMHQLTGIHYAGIHQNG